MKGLGEQPETTQQLVSGKETHLFFRVACCTISLLLRRGGGRFYFYLLFLFNLDLISRRICAAQVRVEGGGDGVEDASCWHKFGM